MTILSRHWRLIVAIAVMFILRMVVHHYAQELGWERLDDLTVQTIAGTGGMIVALLLLGKFWPVKHSGS
ncbi:hypothetical protein ACFFF8_12375 [Novosphingobium clariflavum]|uniref:Uncharacterized protein n=1 Tax=Novosphingobium clariflavum TaxID=2029884 RepID=A0ABV6S834_9SPHN